MPVVRFNAGFFSVFRAKLRKHSFSPRQQLKELDHISFPEANLLLKGIFRTKNLDDILSALGDEENAIL